MPDAALGGSHERQPAIATGLTIVWTLLAPAKFFISMVRFGTIFRDKLENIFLGLPPTLPWLDRFRRAGDLGNINPKPLATRIRATSEGRDHPSAQRTQESFEPD